MDALDATIEGAAYPSDPEEPDEQDGANEELSEFESGSDAERSLLLGRNSEFSPLIRRRCRFRCRDPPTKVLGTAKSSASGRLPLAGCSPQF